MLTKTNFKYQKYVYTMSVKIGTYVSLTCYSEAGAGIKAEEYLDIPEDTQLSAEEDGQLQKMTGAEVNLFNSLSV